MEVPSQFSVGKTAQSLTCYIIEKPHTGLDECLNMLQACFRKKDVWRKVSSLLSLAMPMANVGFLVDEGGGRDSQAVAIEVRPRERLFKVISLKIQ